MERDAPEWEAGRLRILGGQAEEGLTSAMGQRTGSEASAPKSVALLGHQVQAKSSLWSQEASKDLAPSLLPSFSGASGA